MRKNFGAKSILYPQAVFIIASYDENGNIAVDKLRPIVFDGANAAYHVIGEKVGNAFRDGAALK